MNKINGKYTHTYHIIPMNDIKLFLIKTSYQLFNQPFLCQSYFFKKLLTVFVVTLSDFPPNSLIQLNKFHITLTNARELCKQVI